MVNVGVMVGSAVFLTAGEVARALAHPLLQLGAWVLAGLFSLAGALTIAELGAAFPRAGGLYVYLSEAFGSAWGFLYGWALFVVIQTAAIAAVAVALATYFAHFVPLSPLAVQLLAAAVVLGLTALNVRGVRQGVITQNVTTMVKLSLIVGLAVLAFVSTLPAASGLLSSAASASASTSAESRGLLAVMGAALIGPLFAFDGWISISYMGGEVKGPARTLPLAALASVAVVGALYLGINAAYLHVLGSAGVAASALPAADTARALLGPVGADVAAAMVVLTLLGALNGNVLAGARVYFAMAQAGMFWRRVGRVHPRFGTPADALWAQGAVSLLLVFSGRFEQLLTQCLFASWLFYGLGGVAVFVLRRRTDLVRPYHVWGYPLVPALFVLFASVLLIATLVAAPADALMGSLLLLTGLPAFWLFRRTSRHPVSR